MQNHHNPHPSDLTDSEWQVIAPLLNTKRKRAYSLRVILDAIFYVLKTGCQWRYLPNCYPPFALVHYYKQQWSRNELIEQISARLNMHYRKKLERPALPSVCLIDAQCVKNSLRGADEPGFDGYKKVQGYKRHVICDTLGLVQLASYSPANQHDGKEGVKLLETLAAQTLSRIQSIEADQAYRAAKESCQKAGWQLNVTGSLKEKGSGFKLQPQRWKIERVFAWMGYCRRLSRYYERKMETAVAWIYLFNIRRCLRLLTTS